MASEPLLSSRDYNKTIEETETSKLRALKFKQWIEGKDIIEKSLDVSIFNKYHV